MALLSICLCFFMDMKMKPILCLEAVAAVALTSTNPCEFVPDRDRFGKSRMFLIVILSFLLNQHHRGLHRGVGARHGDECPGNHP